ncbi:hypothetical protein ACLB2K_065824 [Fragaria x ananassa]
MCPVAERKNKRLLPSSTIRGMASRLNLPFLKVYSDGRTREVGHLGEVLKVEEDEDCVVGGEASNNERKLKRRGICRFKPRAVMGGASLIEAVPSIPSRRSFRIAKMVTPDPGPPVYVNLSSARGDDGEDDTSLDDDGSRV